jgi:hypothetical protein
MKTDVWHDKEEQFLAKMERQCLVLYQHNMKDFHYYNKLSSKFNIPILIVSSINALTAICLNSFMSQEYVSILNAVLSAGTGVAGSIQLFMKINEKMTNCTRGAIIFKRLALKITKELSIDREQRTSEGVPFLAECFSEFNTALEQGNPIERKLQDYLALNGMMSGSSSGGGTPQSDSPVMRRVADRLISLANRSVYGSTATLSEDFRSMA